MGVGREAALSLWPSHWPLKKHTNGRQTWLTSGFGSAVVQCNVACKELAEEATGFCCPHLDLRDCSLKVVELQLPSSHFAV